MKELAQTDSLTFLNNRYSYSEKVNEINEDLKNQKDIKFTVIMIDLNFLKKLNDVHGHEKGDIAFQRVADYIKEVFGIGNSYRIGGDEYIAFVPDSTANDINARVQELKQKVEQRNYHIAVGVEKQAIDILDMERLIKKAEMRMYKNKEEYYQKIGKEHR